MTEFKADPDCVFCGIINHSMASEVVFEDDSVIVVKDILPKAPVHLLVILKEHVPSIIDLTEAQAPMIGHMILVAKTLALKQGISETGYKLIFNVGKDANQIVKHFHFHMLGGKQLPE